MFALDVLFSQIGLLVGLAHSETGLLLDAMSIFGLCHSDLQYIIIMKTCDEISPGSFKSQLMLSLAYWLTRAGTMVCEHSMDRSLKCDWRWRYRFCIFHMLKKGVLRWYMVFHICFQFNELLFVVVVLGLRCTYSWLFLLLCGWRVVNCKISNEMFYLCCILFILCFLFVQNRALIHDCTFQCVKLP